MRAAVPLHDDLGSMTWPGASGDASAQAYFDQGLRLTFAFNHEEAIRSYQAALDIDSICARCWWGIAYAFGPNINSPMDSASGVEAYHAVMRGQALAAGADAMTAALLQALDHRYDNPPLQERAALDSAYANAMAGVAAAYAAEDHVQTLLAEARMDLMPWDYWDESGALRTGTSDIIASLEGVLARNPDHVGACHFYIHVVEAARPANAEACADRLPALMPGAGHIVHMPAHIYVRVGRWADAITTNEHAVHADEAGLADMAPNGVYRLGYYPHNFHFLWFAASMAGNRTRALQAARDVATRVDTSLLTVQGLEAMQHYLMTPDFARVRFGLWDEILADSVVPSMLPYPRGVRHYARALAHAATGDIPRAEEELQALEQIVVDPVVAETMIWTSNTMGSVLGVAVHVAKGEIAMHTGDAASAIAHLREAVVSEDAMRFDEPPTWHLPARQNLGAVLLASGDAAAAERVYREDLERYPENGWSLFGLAQSLDAQGKSAEAVAVRERFDAAWRMGDVTLNASRF